MARETPDAMFDLAHYPDLPRPYRLRQLLGEGAFSSVYKGTNTQTGETVAIKIISKANLLQKQLANIHNEIHVMNTLANAGSHPNILRLIELFDTQENCFLVLEYSDGGEIFNKIIEYTYFSEPLARHVFLQLLDAIRFMHQHNVVHRDIKPENLLFNSIPYAPRPAREFRAALRSSDDETKRDEGAFVPGVGGGGVGTIKLADFGLAKQLRYGPALGTANNLKTPCGTAGYTAPEVIHCGVERKRRFKLSALKSNYYSKAVDIWSLGCFLYTILCGFPPFYDDNYDVLTQKILTADFVFLEPWWDEVGAQAKDLISKMLVINPEDRITVDEIYRHPWLADAVPLRTDSYFPETSTLDAAPDAATLDVPPPVPPKKIVTPSAMAGGLALPGIAIKQVFANPAMSHVNLKLLADYQRGKRTEGIDPREVKFDDATTFKAKRKSHLPRTPNPMNNVSFKDVFDRKSFSDGDDDNDSEYDSFDESDDSEADFVVQDELADKHSALKYLSISSTLLADSLKMLDDCRTRSLLVISGLNGDYKFTLNLNDLNLLRRRSSVKSGH